ncbi:MAG: SUMF1/EgtB/PvdO family nonheme iron enzyme [Pseudooceanicola sp.]|nr:SUMF1/EgtB/PvdO family nonheme iron enzyme [Pseudooceanicola sp.]
MVGTAGRLPVPARWNGAPATRPETVQIPSGEATYRPFGSFSRDGKAATPAFQNTPVGAFEIMKYQVSRSEYAACVAEGACADAETGSGNMAQTNVNWIDATAYAAWFSDKTGESWRLPTAPEWFRAAAERQNDAAPDETDLDPGERMLSQYRRGVFLRGNSSPTLRPRGGFGQNSLGLADMGGNVWEWTDGCMENGEIDKDGRITLREPYCGVRIAGGRHQAGIVDFVRDARAGGCAAGLPPDYLGFRLVRDNS